VTLAALVIVPDPTASVMLRAFRDLVKRTFSSQKNKKAFPSDPVLYALLRNSAAARTSQKFLDCCP